jgi:D-amino peptidase
MRVLIMSDMEGVAGIAKWEQTEAHSSLYEECRLLYTGEINAAVRGARAAGAKDVLVMDCHGAGGGYTFNSLIPEQLDPGCEWVVQERWTGYTEFLETGCDAALFVGMHARAGVPDGVLNHTVKNKAWQELRFNGVAVGETGINAALCGHWNCPVLLVTGDRATCAEARELLGPGLETVEVKQGLGRFSARMTHPAKARDMIEAGAEKALADVKTVPPYQPEGPTTIEVDLDSSDEADAYDDSPGVERIGPRSIASTGADWLTAWRQFFAEAR